MFARALLTQALIVGTVIAALPAAAVTKGDAGVQAQGGPITTQLAAHARTDLQIRRIKGLLDHRIGGEQAGQEEAAYEHLQRLQKNLRGER